MGVKTTIKYSQSLAYKQADIKIMAIKYLYKLWALNSISQVMIIKPPFNHYISQGNYNIFVVAHGNRNSPLNKESHGHWKGYKALCLTIIL